MRVALIAAVLACTALAATARADVTWTGYDNVNNDGYWSDDINWDLLAPGVDDTAIIPPVTGNGSSGDFVRTITVAGTAAVATLSVPTMSPGYWNILQLDADLTANNTILGGEGVCVLKISDWATFTLGDDTTCDLPSMQTAGNHTGSFVKVGTGTVQVMRFDGTLDTLWWQGTIDIQEGTFEAGGHTVLGSTSMLTVRDGAMFVCGQSSSDTYKGLGLALTLNGSGIEGDGAFQFTSSGTLSSNAAFTLATDSVINVSDADGELTLMGNMDGPGGLTKIGPGTLVLGGICTHAGDTIIEEGTLQIMSSLAGNVTVGPGTTLKATAGQIGGVVTVEGDGVWDNTVSGVWTGNGDPNNDGNWSDGANWSAGEVPTGQATLPPVTGNGNNGSIVRYITVDVPSEVTTLSVPNTSGSFWNILSVDANLTVSNTALGSGLTVILKMSDSTTFTLGDDTTCNLPSMQTIDTHTGSFVKVGTGMVQVMTGDGTLNPEWWSGTIDIQEGTLESGQNTGLGNTSMLTVQDGAMFVCGQNWDDRIGPAVTLNGSGIEEAGALQFTSGKLYTNAAFTLATDSVINVSNEAGEITLLGNTDGSGGLTKIGPGKLLLNGDCQHAGDTVVNAGTIGGTGSLVGKLVLDEGTTLEPGASPATFTVGSAELGGAVFEVEINDAIGTAGTNWDLLDAGTSLELTANEFEPLSIKVVSLDAGNVPGATPNFAVAGAYAWTIAKAATPITGFGQTMINLDIDTEGFFGADEDLFGLAVSANGLELQVLYNKTGALPGDVNDDCVVNILDLIGIRNHLNQDPNSPIENQAYNVNGDDAINILDMIYVRNRLNTSCPEE